MLTKKGLIEVLDRYLDSFRERRRFYLNPITEEEEYAQDIIQYNNQVKDRFYNEFPYAIEISEEDSMVFLVNRHYRSIVEFEKWEPNEIGYLIDVSEHSFDYMIGEKKPINASYSLIRMYLYDGNLDPLHSRTSLLAYKARLDTFSQYLKG
ncbi:hypothetical protein [Ignatzschineria sp. LJL83]